MNIDSKPAIVLVNPTGARNVGSTARVMANFGFSDLRLVNPQCDHLCADSRKMAMRAQPLLEGARVYSNCREALKGFRFIAATSARVRRAQATNMPYSDTLDTAARYQSEAAFLFGTEESGLPNEVLDLADVSISFPTVTEYRSLNLAQSVGIACYETHMRALQQSTASALRPETRERLSGKAEKLLKNDELLELLNHSEEFLSKINFINKQNRMVRMRRLGDLLRRASLSEKDGPFVRALFYFIESRFS